MCVINISTCNSLRHKPLPIPLFFLGKKLNELNKYRHFSCIIRVDKLNQIRPHIGSTRDCGLVLKFERFFQLLGRFLGLGSLIGFGYL